MLRFRTFPTGELFSLLRDHSVLGTVAGGNEGETEGFVHGVARAEESGNTLAALFEARAAALLLDRRRGWVLGYLSGRLIGREIAEGLMPFALSPRR